MPFYHPKVGRIAMRFLMWILTMIFTLAGLALRADGGFAGAPNYSWLAPWIAKGLFILAFLACPLLWTRQRGLVPQLLIIPGKQRFMLALAMLLGTPLILPWPF